MQFYNSLFAVQFNCRPKLDGLSFDYINEVEAIWLERAFEEEELLVTVKAMNSDNVTLLSHIGKIKSCPHRVSGL